MNILISGPSGHIGSALTKQLLRDFPANNFYLIDDFSTNRPTALSGCFDKKHRRVKLVPFKIQDVSTKQRSLLQEKIDIIIHLAAVTDATASLENPQFVRSHNLSSTRAMLEIADRFNSFVIYASSTSVYGVSSGVVTEDQESFLNPQSPYAEAKVIEENMIRDSGLNHAILRFGTIYGVSPGMRFHTAINKFCWQAVTGTPITIWESAFNQLRPYLGLPDACNFVSRVLSNSSFQSGGTTYNVLSENTSPSEITQVLKSVFPQLEISFVKHAIMNQLSYTVCSKKAENFFSWKPNYMVSNGINDTINFLLK